MFDGMPLGKMGKLDEGASADVGIDRISTLPDVLLNYVISFLPAEEAVRTCLLARRWRHLWKFTAGLRFGCLWEDEPKSVHQLQRFVDYFLLLRGCSPLDTCELRIGGFSGNDDVPRVNVWFRHAVLCRVRVLILHIYRNDYFDPWLELDDLPLVSKTLAKLELHGVRCHASFLNFSSCPALEILHFEYCDLSLTMKISSDSIKSLSVIDSTLGDDSRVLISAPNLVSLQLDNLWDKTPILESMPALTGAFVRIAELCDDRCIKMSDPYQNCNCESCESSDSIGDQSNNSVLLEGLSEATSLVLISRPDVFILKRDLRWCPMFYNLRTLLLNEYCCGPDGIHALACILEHTPNLEKLTLQLFSEGPKHNVEMEGSFSSAVQSAGISKNLKIIEIKCEVVDERVAKVLKFLCTFNISFSF